MNEKLIPALEKGVILHVKQRLVMLGDARYVDLCIGTRSFCGAGVGRSGTELVGD